MGMDASRSSVEMKLWIRSACQVVQIVNDASLLLKGAQMQQVAVLQQRLSAAGQVDGAGLVVSSDGVIADIGYDSEISGKYPLGSFQRIIDASGQCILPGLIDAHTHPVWAGDRVHEFSMKLAGASYMDIHKAGGGIYFTVDHTQAASEEELYESLQQRMRMMLDSGTTTAEVKSGYGLDFGSEVKLLRVLQRVKTESPVSMSVTYCGAHAVPKGSSADAATEAIVHHDLPQLRRLTDTGALSVDNVDIFCERGVFSVEQTRRILQQAISLGFRANFHAEELSYLGATEMGVEVGALAISHLEHISAEGIRRMGASSCVAVLLPTTAFLMRLTPPPVRQMIQEGVAVALGSDFNPNAYCSSMPIVMHLAAVTFHMSLPEVLVASTLNAAASLGLSRSLGSIERGKQADLLLIRAPRWEHLVYQLGNHNLISLVIKNGNVVLQR